MKNSRSKIGCLPTTILFVLTVSVWLLICTNVAAAFDFHADTAHGNTSYGVDRSGTDYTIGDCAHCHEAFDPSVCGVNELMMFAPMNPTGQTDNFCLLCHKGDGSVQVDGVTNNNYGATFGGEDPATFSSIYDALNPGAGGSSHSLQDIQTLLQGGTLKTASGDDWSLDEIQNPCGGCHNPHIAQKNNDSPYDPTRAAISRPSDHNNLWGDEAPERMDAYTSKYQSPYWSGGTYYEPGYDSTQDGSNLPDYVTLCTDCHNTYNTIYSTNLGRNLKSVNWGGSGDKHGGRNAAENECRNLYDLVDPYNETLKREGHNYVLACTDCHEPHGSAAPYLLRTQVNGQDLSYAGDIDAFYKNQFCTACHDVADWLCYGSPCWDQDCPQGYAYQHPYSGCSTSGCHYHGRQLCPPSQCQTKTF